MIVTIKEVGKCRNGAFGNFVLRRSGDALITISRKRNPDMAEYAATLLHEILHLWVTLLRLKGFRVKDRKEHRFIYAVEDVVIAMVRKHMKKAKKEG
jgi:antirestriction protein ArdC